LGFGSVSVGNLKILAEVKILAEKKKRKNKNKNRTKKKKKKGLTTNSYHLSLPKALPTGPIGLDMIACCRPPFQGFLPFLKLLQAGNYPLLIIIQEFHCDEHLYPSSLVTV